VTWAIVAGTYLAKRSVSFCARAALTWLGVGVGVAEGFGFGFGLGLGLGLGLGFGLGLGLTSSSIDAGSSAVRDSIQLLT